MNPTHVILELLQILDVAVADFANDEASAALRPRLPSPGLLGSEAGAAALSLADGLFRQKDRRLLIRPS